MQILHFYEWVEKEALLMLWEIYWAILIDQHNNGTWESNINLSLSEDVRFQKQITVIGKLGTMIWNSDIEGNIVVRTEYTKEITLPIDEE